MTDFWFVAGPFCAVAVAFLVFPLWRHRRRAGRWSVVGLASAVAVVPAAIGLYVAITTWDPEVAGPAAQRVRLVSALAQQLAERPDDVEAWKVLGASYMALGEYVRGRNAFREAWIRSPAPDNELKVAFAESMVLTDRAALSGDAARLLDEVLAAEPNNLKALWYGGLAAQEIGREDEWRARWSRLLALDQLPEPLAEVVRTQLGAAAGEGGADAGPTVNLKITLAEGKSAADLGPRAALFIFARAPNGGPPIAAIREPATAVPGEFRLSDANSMIPGRSLADHEELTLVARLSQSGDAAEQAGDWYGQTTFKRKEAEVVELVIDQVVQ